MPSQSGAPRSTAAAISDASSPIAGVAAVAQDDRDVRGAARAQAGGDEPDRVHRQLGVRGDENVVQAGGGARGERAIEEAGDLTEATAQLPLDGDSGAGRVLRRGDEELVGGQRAHGDHQALRHRRAGVGEAGLDAHRQRQTEARGCQRVREAREAFAGAGVDHLDDQASHCTSPARLERRGQRPRRALDVGGNRTQVELDADRLLATHRQARVAGAPGRPPPVGEGVV